MTKANWMHMSKTLRFTCVTSLLATHAAWAAESSIPQMDQASYPGQLVWLGISFLLLYALVSGFIVPRVRGVVSKRETAIAQAIAAAEELKATANATKGHFEQATIDARNEAAAMIAEAQTEAAKASQQALAALDRDLQAKSAAAKKDLAAAIAKAQAEMDAASATLGGAMAAQLLGPRAQANPTKKAS